jgi:hypothetical protein
MPPASLNGWKLRELCIATTLFEAGARISEITGLSVADWAYGQFMNRLTAKNKGSFGVRMKVLIVSNGSMDQRTGGCLSLVTRLSSLVSCLSSLATDHCSFVLAKALQAV